MRIRVSPSFTLSIQAQTNLNSNMSTLIILQQAGARGQYGWSFLLDPINLVDFIVTVFGLFLIAMFGLMITLPAMKKLPVKIGLRRIGATMTAFGGYFVFNLLYYYLTGGYVAHPNVWYEVIGPPHNLNLWCVTFLFLGLALLVSRE